MIFERENVHDKQGTGHDQVDQGSEQCEEKTEKHQDCCGAETAGDRTDAKGS